MAQISTLKSHGVAPAGFIWAHAQNEADNRLRLRAAEAGGWVEFDGISSAAAEDMPSNSTQLPASAARRRSRLSASFWACAQMKPAGATPCDLSVEICAIAATPSL